MAGKQKPNENDILQTTESFVAALPWGPNRRILVFRRQHGGRTYVRLRVWNLHRRFGTWYPSDRFFVVPIDEAEGLAAALVAGAQGKRLHRKPDWLTRREADERDGKGPGQYAGLIEEIKAFGAKLRQERRRNRRLQEPRE